MKQIHAHAFFFNTWGRISGTSVIPLRQIFSLPQQWCPLDSLHTSKEHYNTVVTYMPCTSNSLFYTNDIIQCLQWVLFGWNVIRMHDMIAWRGLPVFSVTIANSFMDWWRITVVYRPTACTECPHAPGMLMLMICWMLWLSRVSCLTRLQTSQHLQRQWMHNART